MFRCQLGITAAAATLLLVGSCGPTSEPAGRGTGEEPPSATPKTLTVAIHGEPGNLAIPSMGDVPVGSTGGGDFKMAVHHRLATYDHRGAVHPQLAAQLPSREGGTWLVRPDGSMQTTYPLRRNATWHDGTPLTARDFVFAWTVTTDPDIAVSGRFSSQIGRIETPDEFTLILEWASTYPFANAVVEDEMAPLPAHLIGDAYRTDKARFQHLEYWTREFIGTGPYRLAAWEPGSHIVLHAFNGFYAGRPQIDVLTIRFIPDESTVVANLLAGTVDGAIPRAIEFNRAMFVKGEWEKAGRKPVIISQTTHWRLLEVQLRPELARPTEIRDPRVRRGLLHALDRQAMVDALLAGQAPPSDTLLPPDDVRWEWVSDVTTRYPYSPRRAEEVLSEVGWRRSSDGPSVNAGGERVTVPIWTRPGEQSEQEIAIIGDQWKALGLGVEQVILSPGQARDNRVIATFPGFAPTANPLAFENTMQVLHGGACPSDRTRWTGRNHGCYQSPEWDRTVDALRTAIESDAQKRLWRELVRIHTDELPVLPLYFNIQVVVFREGVTGVKGDTRPRTSSMWNVAEWDVS